jgi:hypothetical protein
MKTHGVGLVQLEVMGEEAVEADLHGVQVQLVCPVSSPSHSMSVLSIRMHAHIAHLKYGYLPEHVSRKMRI